MKNQRFVIFDANAVIHRAYHALPPLTSKDGEVVNAVYGFTMIVLKVLNELKPDYVVAAFDLPSPTFRHKEYSEYKATRQKAADDLLPQFSRVTEVVEALNIPSFSKKGYEADDIIGSLAKKVSDSIETIIVTGDLDELQLVNENTKVYTMQRGFTDTVIYDENKVNERYGLTPKEFIEYKALKGDSSDNIPGVPGVGEKTAVDLIKKYHNLETIYEHFDEIKTGVKNNLENYKDQAFLSRRLSTIVTDLSLDLDLEKTRTHDFDRQKVVDLFRELGFKSLLNKLPEPDLFQRTEKVHKKKAANGNYTIINTKKKFEKLLSILKKSEFISFDTETTDLDEINAELVGLCFSVKEKEGWYVPIGHRSQKPQLNLSIQSDLLDGQLDLNYVFSNLKPILEDSKIQKIGHNLKYDYKIMHKYDIKLNKLNFDTMIAAYLLNPNARAQKLSDLSFTELGIEMIPITDLIGKGKDQLKFSGTAIKEAALYAAEDADIALRLCDHLKPMLEKEGFSELFNDIEMPLVSILGDMELAGIKIDKEALKKMSKIFEKRIDNLEKKIWKMVGAEFNIASPLQLKEILFDKLKLVEDPEIRKNLKKTKTGGYSTAATELEKIRGLHPIIDLISEYREITKLKSTYIDALPLLVNDRTERVHTSYNQAITATGRLSSSDPNLQNIPIRTDLGNDIRKAFITEKGYKLLAADYSQIELRIVAHIADDKKMIEAFKSKEDIHTRTAALVMGVKDKDVDSNMRRIAKVVNFGVLYGMSPHGLSQATGMSREEAKDFIDKYFRIHDGIARYVDEIKAVAEKLGYVETLFGRKRYIPEINSPNHIVRAAAERTAVNMPIQGSAADLLKLAMIDIDKDLQKISGSTKMLLQVHDELVFEVPEKNVEKVAHFVGEKMEHVIQLKVPIEVKIEVGDNWGEMKEVLKMKD